MKTVKLTLVLFVALILIAAIPVYAFHNGSQLVCDNCHTMHYSEGGVAPPSKAEGYPQNADSGGPFPHLLVKANITDLCLQCHMNNQYTGAPSVLNTTPGSGTLLPGGDFGYTYNVSPSALPGQVPGGHNPFGNSGAPSANINPSPDGGATGLVPPGNTGAALTNFVCTNCHGEHGPESGNVNFSNPSSTQSYQNYGYRLLLGVVNGNNTVAADSIVSQAWVVSGGAVVAGPDGANLTVSESSTNHNVYKGGFSEWCSSCHANFHSESNTDSNVYNGTAYIRHPTNYNLTSGIIRDYGSNYNYVYPLNVVTNSDGQTPTNENPISTNDKIMCLTCHKAHATANPNSLRWDPTQASALGQCNTCHQVGGGI